MKKNVHDGAMGFPSVMLDPRFGQKYGSVPKPKTEGEKKL